MSVRIKTDMLVSALGYTAQFNMSKALYGGGGQTKINHAATKGFDPFLKSVYDEVRKQKGGQDVTPSELSAAFEAKGAALIKQAAGVGRSATYVSEAEAEKLPPSLQTMFHSLKARRQRAADERAALFEPFPRGIAKPELFFSRYVAHLEVRAASEMLGDTKLEEALPALAKAAKKAPIQLGELTVYAAKDDNLEVGGRKFYNGNGGSKLAIARGDEVVMIGWSEGFGDAKVATIDMNRFSLQARHGDPMNGTTYHVPGTSMQDLLAKISMHSPKAAAGIPKESEEQQLLDRWPSVDLVGLETVLRAIHSHAGAAGKADAAAKLAASTTKKVEAALPQFVEKAQLLDKYAELAALVKKKGELALGDMDTYVRIADKFSKPYEDDDGNEHESVLVEGKGPLLIVDNHFGGLGHAIPLSAIEARRIELYVSHEDQRRGLLAVDAQGKVVSAPDDVMIHRVANDLLDYLPAQLED